MRGVGAGVGALLLQGPGHLDHRHTAHLDHGEDDCDGQEVDAEEQEDEEQVEQHLHGAGGRGELVNHHGTFHRWNICEGGFVREFV